jgi:hypothetical protein
MVRKFQDFSEDKKIKLKGLKCAAHLVYELNQLLNSLSFVLLEGNFSVLGDESSCGTLKVYSKTFLTKTFSRTLESFKSLKFLML